MMKNLPKDYNKALSKFLDLDGFIGVIDEMEVDGDVSDCNIRRGDYELLQMVPYDAFMIEQDDDGFVGLEEFKMPYYRM